MNSIELEKQLEAVKKQEKEDSLRQDCENARKEFEGKAYGSRSFEKDAKSSNDSAIYIKSIYLGKGTNMGDDLRILADIWQVNRIRMDGNYKFSRDHYSYSRSRNQEQALSSKEYNVHYNIHNLLPYSFLKVEITPEKFMSIWNAAIEHEIVLNEAFQKEVGNTKELIRMGDSRDMKEISEIISSIGLSSEIIDVETLYPKLWEEIRYCNLPMFQDQKWLSKAYGKVALNYQIKSWQKEMADKWTSYRHQTVLAQRIRVVNDHLIYF